MTQCPYVCLFFQIFLKIVDFPLRASAKLGHSCELLFVIFPYGIICVSLLLYAAFYWKKKKVSHAIPCVFI